MTPTPSEISHKNDLSLDDPFAEPYLDESVSSGRKRIRSGEGGETFGNPVKKKVKKEKKSKNNYVIDSDEDLPIVKPKKNKKEKEKKSSKVTPSEKKDKKDKQIDKKPDKKSEKQSSKSTKPKKQSEKPIEIPDSPKKGKPVEKDSKSPVKKRSKIEDQLEALKKGWVKPSDNDKEKPKADVKTEAKKTGTS